MFYAGDLFAIFVFVGSRWLVPYELHARLWVLALAEPSEVLRPNCTVQAPLLGKRTAPLTVRLALAAPVVLLF